MLSIGHLAWCIADWTHSDEELLIQLIELHQTWTREDRLCWLSHKIFNKLFGGWVARSDRTHSIARTGHQSIRIAFAPFGADTILEYNVELGVSITFLITCHIVKPIKTEEVSNPIDTQKMIAVLSTDLIPAVSACYSCLHASVLLYQLSAILLHRSARKKFCQIISFHARQQVHARLRLFNALLLVCFTVCTAVDK